MDKIIISIITLLLFATTSSATDYVLVADMSLLKYQIYNDRFNIRNLNEFDSTWQGCCGVYYVDLTTETGKVMYSNIITAIALKKRLYIGVTSKVVNPSQVIYVGDW